MAHNPITLDLLKALDAIDQRGSFAAAAQALHKVPSALTYTIQKVEQDLNLSLFDRSGHRAKLTPAGKLVLEQGRRVLREIDSLANSAKKLASGWEAEITITLDTLFAAENIFPLVHQFNNEHPFVRVNIGHGSLSGTWEQLLNGKADVVLCGDLSAPKLDDYQKKVMGEIEMVFAVGKNHPLAADPCNVSDEIIEQYPVILIPDSSQIMAPLTVGWTRSNRTISVTTMEEKIAAQKAGIGVGYLPRHRIQAELDSGELVSLTVKRNSGKAVIAWRPSNVGPCPAMVYRAS